MRNTWPPTLEHIVQFIGYMSVKEMSDSTARTYIAGITYQLKINNEQDITQIFLIRKLLEGYRRKNKTKDSRLPITANILIKISNYPLFLFCITLMFIKIIVLIFSAKVSIYTLFKIKSILFAFC